MGIPAYWVVRRLQILTSWATLFLFAAAPRITVAPTGRKPGDLQAHMAAAEQFARQQDTNPTAGNGRYSHT